MTVENLILTIRACISDQVHRDKGLWTAIHNLQIYIYMLEFQSSNSFWIAVLDIYGQFSKRLCSSKTTFGQVRHQWVWCSKETKDAGILEHTEWVQWLNAKVRFSHILPMVRSITMRLRRTLFHSECPGWLFLLGHLSMDGNLKWGRIKPPNFSMTDFHNRDIQWWLKICEPFRIVYIFAEIWSKTS